MDQQAVVASPERRNLRRQTTSVQPGTTGRPIEISVIMPTVFWTGTFERCGRRLLSLIDASGGAAEAIFVLDGPATPSPAWLDRPDVTVVTTGKKSGPAVARNLAAGSARGKILFFVDADVELAEDAIDTVARAFGADADLVAVFGSYDDEPAATGVASQFRNLLHHYVHSSHPGSAVTFWSGCGAIRAAVFSDVGGFDESFLVPSVEDIDLGLRITALGGRIVLAPELRCKHLKPWTLVSMTVTDVVHRAIPWSRLILTRHSMPSTLNIDWRGRLSGLCAVVLACCLPALFFVPATAWVAVACIAALVGMNLGFYTLCLKKQGFGFAITSIALHWLYFVYSSLTFGLVMIHGLLGAGRRPVRSASPRVEPSAAQIRG